MYPFSVNLNVPNSGTPTTFEPLPVLEGLHVVLDGVQADLNGVTSLTFAINDTDNVVYASGSAGSGQNGLNRHVPSGRQINVVATASGGVGMGRLLLFGHYAKNA